MRALQAHAASNDDILCVLFEDSSLTVLTAARDAIHAGWTLLHHPLYGNYRPHQQPYRSILLQSPPAERTGEGFVVPDESSLHFIEEAMLVYKSGTVLTVDKAPASLLEACALLDFDLMRLPLQQAGCLSEAGQEMTRTCA